MPLLQEGLNIRGTYEVEKFLGEGAFAEVYRVRHQFLGATGFVGGLFIEQKPD